MVNIDLRDSADSTIELIKSKFTKDKITVRYSPDKAAPSDISVSVIRSVSKYELFLGYDLEAKEIRIGIANVGYERSLERENPQAVLSEIDTLLSEVANNTLKLYSYKVFGLTVHKAFRTRDTQLEKHLNNRVKWYKLLPVTETTI